MSHSLGDRIRSLRSRADLTQAQLAQKAKVSEALVRKLETGRILNPRLQSLTKLSRALGVKVSSLTGERAAAVSS